MQQTPNNDLYNFPSERTKGIIGTVIFHVLLAVLLISAGLHTTKIPEEEGILVNFGTDETGSGLVEPSPSSTPPVASSEEADDTEEETQQEEAVSETQAEETQMTQDFEEAPVVKKEKEQVDPEEEEERIRQQKLEEERQRKEAEEAERKRQEEAERQRLEEEQRRRTEIMNRTRNALENARGSGENENEGIEGGEGNQGKETGSTESDIYGEGSGTGTEGVSFDLAGRQPRSLPKPSYDIQEEGIVVVEVTVDRNGNVINARPGVRGSSNINEYFLKVAKEAALKSKFDKKPDAPSIQKGTITYHFILR